VHFSAPLKGSEADREYAASFGGTVGAQAGLAFRAPFAGCGPNGATLSGLTAPTGMSALRSLAWGRALRTPTDPELAYSTENSAEVLFCLQVEPIQSFSQHDSVLNCLFTDNLFTLVPNAEAADP
jgi:hypothetical protein